MSCPLCEISWRDWPDLWWSWQEDQKEAVLKAARLGVDEKTLRAHMENHRPPQPPRPGTWRSRDINVSSITDRQRLILELLRGGAPLSGEDIAFFLIGSDKSAKMQIARALRSLLAKQMLYRLYLEYLPGPGPRPPQPPALYTLGKSAKAVSKESIKKRSDWFESLDDFASWKEPYSAWQKNHRAALLFSSFSAVSFAGLKTEPRFQFTDPLLGKGRLKADSSLQIIWRERPFLLLNFRDNQLLRPKETIKKAVRFAALQRSKEVKGLSLALIETDTAERGKELLSLGKKHTFPEKTLILVSPKSEIEKGNPRWRSLYHNQSGHLEEFLAWLWKKEASGETGI